jgi:putative ABC transport system substrate-binding protein
MNRRIVLLIVALNLAGATTTSWAQQPNRIPVVGWLAAAAGPDDPLVEALRQGLRERGYLEGRNIKLEFRTAQGHPDRLSGLAEELVTLKADVIVVPNPIAAHALRRATSTIPIVVALFDPLASGLVTNLARPGGNITGLSSMTSELRGKRLQLLKEAIPRLSRVSVLWNPATLPTPSAATIVEDLKAAARSLSIELKFVTAQTPEEIDPAFSEMSRAQAQAMLLNESALFYVHRITLAKLASKARLPAMYGTRAYADAGGLMSYGMNYADQMRRVATFVDKILKGAKPEDLPIEQPTKFELVVNLRTAKALGITIPQSILLRADEVIR